jgi:hypothetical protein
MEEFLESLNLLIETLRRVPYTFWRILFSPRHFFCNFPSDSYAGYLVTAGAIGVGVFAPQMPGDPLSEMKGTLMRIPKFVLKKITNLILKFVFKCMILYIALIYGVMLYVVFLPFAYPVEWRLHFQGLVYVFSTICILCCIVLVLDRIFYKLYGSQPLLKSFKTMMKEFEEERLQKKEGAGGDQLTKSSSQPGSPQMKWIRKLLIGPFRVAYEKAEKQRVRAEKFFKDLPPFQKVILFIFCLYYTVFIFAAMYWLHFGQDSK